MPQKNDGRILAYKGEQENATQEEDTVATVHGDDIRIGGERSAVEFLIKMTSKRYGKIQTLRRAEEY